MFGLGSWLGEGKPVDATAKDAVPVYAPVPVRRWWRQASRSQRAGVCGAWIASLLACIGLGLASVAYQWSGLALPFGSMELYVTVYPPLVFSLFWVIWFGFWWGFIPAYLSTLILSLYSGMPLGWSLLFAFADPLGLAVFALAYRSIPFATDLRNVNALLFFVLLSFVAGIFGSTGSFIWTHTNALGIRDVFPLWQGWWLGAFLQNLLFVAPFLWLFGQRVTGWLQHLGWRQPVHKITPGLSLAVAAVVLGGVLIYLFVTQAMSGQILQAALAAEDPMIWKATAQMVSESALALFWVLFTTVLFIFFFGSRIFMHWMSTLKASSEALKQANTQLRAEVTERRQVEAELQAHNGYLAHVVELSSQLHMAQTRSSAIAIMAQLLPEMFPHTAGALSLMDDEGALQLVTCWGGDEHGDNLCLQPCKADPVEAWERSRSNGDDFGWTPCDAGRSGGYCLPLVAAEQSLGVLQLDRLPRDIGSDNRLMTVLAEQLALALINLNLRESLVDQANHDPLTGLYNRRYMHQWLAGELSRSSRRDSPLGAILIDIDLFKHINDTHGHLVGDRVLQVIGRYLHNQVREGDLVCRFGGEEFLVLLPGADKADATRRAEALRSAIETLPIHTEEGTLGVTISAGVAGFSAHGQTADSLLQSADQALYRAKETGRNRVVVADQAEQQSSAMSQTRS